MYQKKLLFATLLNKNDQKKIKGGNGCENCACNLEQICITEGERCGSDNCVCENIGYAIVCMPQDIVKVPTP
jgi:hypothetical protein